MRKIGAVLLLILFSLVIVSAQNDTIDEKAYECLSAKLGDNCANSGSVEQLSFSLLAIAGNSAKQQDCKSKLLDKESSNNFGSIKETSLAIIALNEINQNTDDYTDYLISKEKTADLEWYLEIDSNEATDCKVSGSTVKIDDDKKVTSVSGSCFSKAYGNYWIRIDDNCYDKNITVSCDKDFLSTLLYKTQGSNTWHVTSDVQSASANGKTSHQINSYCISKTSSCDYEGTLWAALALQRTDNSFSELLPYLVAYSEDNEDFFPESFLYILTGSQEYLDNILTLQATQGYWKLGDNEYYDTALGLLSLSESSSTLSWLEEKQGNDGCWNNGNIRDTAFILWAGWPRTPVIVGGTTKSDCEPDYYCLSPIDCSTQDTLDNFYCPYPKICCDTPIERTCTEMGGEICSSGQDCDISTITDSKGYSCCLGDCELEQTECEEYGYNCRLNCFDNEEQADFNCDSGDVCCRTKQDTGTSYWWIWLLVILIVLVVLGIIFRDKLRLFIFKFGKGIKKGPISRTRPGFPSAAPRMFRPQIRRRPSPRREALRKTRKPETKSDKELDDTMKKLREMSK